MSWLQWGAALAGGGFAIAYLGLPALVRGQQWLPERYRLDPLPFDDYIGMMSPHYQQQVALLRQQGFEVVSFVVPELSVDASLTLLHHPRHQVLAMVASLASGNSCQEYTEIARAWDNGELLVMNNCPINNPFPEDPQRLLCRLPGSAPEMLWELFLRTDRYLTRARHLTPRRLAAADTLAFVEAYLQREAERMSALGYFQPPRDGRRRCTWKGAYLMTWQALWPVRGIIARRHGQAVNQLLTLAGEAG